MNFSVGDLIVMTASATQRYTLTTEGVVGIIVSIPKNSDKEIEIEFPLKLNSHHLFLTRYLTSNHYESMIWPIDVGYIKLLKTVPLEDKIITKIKELDHKWMAKQKEKGKDYALLRL